MLTQHVLLSRDSGELKLQGSAVKKGYYSFGQVLENLELISDKKEGEKKV